MITVRMHGAKRTRRQIGAFSVLVKENIRRQVMTSALAIQGGARRRVSVDVGQLRNSIRPVFYDDGLSAEVFTDVLQGPFVEFGTRPHPTSKFPGRARKMPPPGVLKDWIRRHGLSIPEFVLRRHIMRHGTEAKPFLFPAWEEERPDYFRGIRAAVRGAGRRSGRGAGGRA